MPRRFRLPVWLLGLGLALALLPPHGATVHSQGVTLRGLNVRYQAQVDALVARAAALIAAVDDLYIPKFYCADPPKDPKKDDRLRLAQLQEDQDQLAADYTALQRGVRTAATQALTGRLVEGDADPSNPNYWSS